MYFTRPEAEQHLGRQVCVQHPFQGLCCGMYGTVDAIAGKNGRYCLIVNFYYQKGFGFGVGRHAHRVTKRRFKKSLTA